MKTKSAFISVHPRPAITLSRIRATPEPRRQHGVRCPQRRPARLRGLAIAEELTRLCHVVRSNAHILRSERLSGDERDSEQDCGGPAHLLRQTMHSRDADLGFLAS